MSSAKKPDGVGSDGIDTSMEESSTSKPVPESSEPDSLSRTSTDAIQLKPVSTDESNRSTQDSGVALSSPAEVASTSSAADPTSSQSSGPSKDESTTFSSSQIKRRKRHGHLRTRPTTTASSSSSSATGEPDQGDEDDEEDVLMVVDRKNSDAAKRAGVAVRDTSSSDDTSSDDGVADREETVSSTRRRRRRLDLDDLEGAEWVFRRDAGLTGGASGTARGADTSNDSIDGPPGPPAEAVPEPTSSGLGGSLLLARTGLRLLREGSARVCGLRWSGGGDDAESMSENIEQMLAYRPKGTWKSTCAIRQRELGARGRRALANQDWFRYRAIGSQYCVERMDCMWKLRKHEGCVNALNFNASGTLLCSGSDDTNVVIWDWLYNKDKITFDTGHQLNVFQCKFMPLSGDSHIVTCARDGMVRLAELSNTGECRGTRKLARHSASAHKLAIQDDSPHVFLSCGEDSVVYQLDLRDHLPNKLLVCRNQAGRKVPLYTIQSNPMDSTYFAVAGRDTFTRIYDKRKLSEGGDPVKTFCPHRLLEADFKPHVTCIAYNYNGTELLASYNDDDVYCFDTTHSDGADFKFRYQGHRNSATVKGVNWYGPRSEFVISGSDCGHVYFWERESQAIVHFVPADEGGVVNVLEPHPTCAALAVSGLDHDVKVFLPVADEEVEFDKAKLTELVKENLRQRMRERTHPDPESDFIYYILRTIMRRRRREHRAAGGGRQSSESTEEPDNDDDDDEEEEVEAMDASSNDDDGAGGVAGAGARDNPAQCRTS